MPTNHVQYLIDLLKLSEDEVLKALLAAFVPSNPGSLASAWSKRTNYTAPSGETLWQIMVAADFRCDECKSHYDLTFHHRNDDPHDSRAENLQLLCRNCNRATSGRPVERRDLRISIFKAYVDHFEQFGCPPTAIEIRRYLNLDTLGGSTYMFHFLNTRYGTPTKLRSYRSKSGTTSDNA